MSSSPPNRLLPSVVLVVVAGLASTAVALGSHFDPEERLRAGDQARARAMLLRQSDLGPRFAVERTSDLDAHVTCRALDLSDLVVTGRAASPRWGRDLVVIGSSAAVYRTAADARAAWRRSTSKARTKCVRDAFQDLFRRQGEAVRVSIARRPFPLLASRTAAWRMTLFGAGTGPIATVDTVVLAQGRAQASMLFAGVLRPVAQAHEIALARVVARRLQAAMRGS